MVMSLPPPILPSPVHKPTDLPPRSQMSVKNCFIRGSVVRYVQIPRTAVDTTLLEDATRRGEYGSFVRGYGDGLMRRGRGSGWEEVDARVLRITDGSVMDGMYYHCIVFYTTGFYTANSFQPLLPRSRYLPNRHQRSHVFASRDSQ
jgi:hypothetical protein